MHPDLDELRPKLKEILYDFAVELHATKAALFLLDVGTRQYYMITEYGFRSAIRPSVSSSDTMIDRCNRGRSPFFVNDIGAEPKLAALLRESSSERLMGVPLFSRGQLVGFIDVRDKAQKQPFEKQDLSTAQSIADRILGVFAHRNIWNQRFVTLSDADPVTIPSALPAPEPNVNRPMAVRAADSQPAGPAGEPAPHPAHDSILHRIVSEARDAVPRILAPPAPGRRAIGLAEMVVVTDALRSILLLPGAVAAVFSATGSGGAQQVASRGTMTQDALTALQVKQQTWLNKRGESVGALHTTLSTPVGLTMSPITVSQLQKVYSAAVNSSRFRGLYLTVAFGEPPDRTTHELLSALLTQLEGAIESSTARTSLHTTRLRIAERLLEPDFTKFEELRRHSMMVTELVEAFTKFLALPAAEAENIKITAIVHDAGMRLLDYEQLYRKREVSHSELALLHEHPVVSAAIVEPLLGIEIARAVLYHHERVDGGGYPHHLSAAEIPLASRVVQICDVYLAICDPHTYHTPGTTEDALAAIHHGAGVQFDAELAVRFEEMMRATAKLAGR